MPSREELEGMMDETQRVWVLLRRSGTRTVPVAAYHNLSDAFREAPIWLGWVQDTPQHCVLEPMELWFVPLGPESSDSDNEEGGDPTCV